ncbi:hypothetical protein PIB30_011530 [Stylosanthes scabra]|uniref:Uncharacterized protein n=1 Tax=Stylosanthes scabra TaxID=79078 RepID=A0ABU6T781_9FABA|nr:hypothetical protein [Stylosanthes scabra]
MTLQEIRSLSAKFEANVTALNPSTPNSNFSSSAPAVLRRPHRRQKPPQSPSLQAEVVIATSIAASHYVSRLTSSSNEKHRPQSPSPLPILTSPSHRRRRSSPHHRYCPPNRRRSSLHRGVLATEVVVLASFSATAPPPSSSLCRRRSRKMVSSW